MQGMLPLYELSCTSSPTTNAELNFSDDCGLFGVFYDYDGVPTQTEFFGEVFPIPDTASIWKGNLYLQSVSGVHNYVYLPGTALYK